MKIFQESISSYPKGIQLLVLNNDIEDEDTGLASLMTVAKNKFTQDIPVLEILNGVIVVKIDT
jgi:hypothetical protein